MGWKCACILTGDCEPGYLSTFPKHDPVRAAGIMKQLGVPYYYKAPGDEPSLEKLDVELFRLREPLGFFEKAKHSLGLD